MSRALRIEYDGACYHIMARGVARMETFLDDSDRKLFLSILERQVQAGHLLVHAFCLMPNHYHLLASTPQGGLSRWMRHVNGDYVRNFNSRSSRVGHLWQGRYKAILVEDGPYLLECSRYIHLNPNRARLTRPAERWRWSSYRNYVGGPPAAPWVETGRVLATLGGDRKAYRAYVEAGKGEKPISPFERAVSGLALGGAGFVEGIRRRVEALTDAGEQPSLASLRREGRADPAQVEQAVEKTFAGLRAARKRRLLLYAQRVHSPLRPVEIARRYHRRPSAVTMAVRAIEVESHKRPELAQPLGALAEALRPAESEK